MTKEEIRLERWTEKIHVANGVAVRYLKPARNCRKKNPKKTKIKKVTTNATTHSKGDRMKLITKEIEKKLPSLATVEDQYLEDLVAIVKFFHPLYPWSWVVFGGNKRGDDFMFYGMAFNPDCPNGELGYFTLKQLQEIETPFGAVTFRVERDKLFKPTPAMELR